MYPILFSSGPINIYSFGVFLFLAFIASSFYVWREGKNELEEELIFDALVISTLGLLLGSRLLYIFSHFSSFNFDLLRWIHLYLYPGFSFWGVVLGALLSVFWFARVRKVSFWRLADFLVLGAALAQIFGGTGCFLSGCIVGEETTLPWGMPALGFLGQRHPVALYDLFAAIVIFFLILRVHRWVFPQKRRREGSVFLVYLMLLASTVFLLEFFRVSTVYLYDLTLNQLAALLLLVGAGVVWYGRLRHLPDDVHFGFVFLKRQIRRLKGVKDDKVSRTSA